MDTRQTHGNSWNRIALGILIEVLSIFCFLCLVGAFGSVGNAVAGFLVGFFGLADYAYSLIGMILGIVVIAKRKPTTHGAKIAVLFSMLLVGILALQVYTSNQHIVDARYGDYLLNCYNFTNTAGGMLLGVITYPMMRALTNVGALVLCCIIFFTLVFVALIPTLRKNQTYDAPSKRVREGKIRKSKEQKDLEKHAYIKEDKTESSIYKKEDDIKPEEKPQSLNPIEGGEDGQYSLRNMARNVLFSNETNYEDYEKFKAYNDPDGIRVDTQAPYSMQKQNELKDKLGYEGKLQYNGLDSDVLNQKPMFEPKPTLTDFESIKQEQIKRYREMFSGVEPVYEAEVYDKPEGDKVFEAEVEKQEIQKPEKVMDHGMILNRSVNNDISNNRQVTTGMQGVVNRARNRNNILELRPEELQANAYKQPEVIDEVRIPKAFEQSTLENKPVDTTGGYYNGQGLYVQPECKEEKKEVVEEHVDNREVLPPITDDNRPQVQGFDDTPYQPMPWQVMVPVKKQKHVQKQNVRTTTNLKVDQVIKETKPKESEPLTFNDLVLRNEAKKAQEETKENKIEEKVEIKEEAKPVVKEVVREEIKEEIIEEPKDEREEAPSVETTIDDKVEEDVNIEDVQELFENSFDESQGTVVDEETKEEPVNVVEKVIEKPIIKEVVREVVVEKAPEEKETYKKEEKVEVQEGGKYGDKELKERIKAAAKDEAEESEIEKRTREREEEKAREAKERREMLQMEQKVKALEKIDKTKERVSQVSIDQAIEQATPKKPYVAPPLSLLIKPEPPLEEQDDYEEKAQIIVDTLDSFNVKAEVLEREVGPTFSLYTLHVEMPRGRTIGTLVSLEKDIAMKMQEESVRILAPIPGKDAVGIEVPNKQRRIVRLSELLNTDTFANLKAPESFGLGKNLYGEDFFCKIKDLPHMLIAGATGAGKSCCINSIIISLLYKASPDDVRLILVDPKRVELSMYEGIPHLLLDEIVCDVDKAIRALNWAIDEMNRRISFFQEQRVRDIDEYNEEAVKNNWDKIPRIVLIVDELADLMDLGKKSVENAINRIARLARATGIHMILATQRPSVDVVSGTIKNNLPSRVAFKVTSSYDSRTILDVLGAEKLLGYGDLLYMTPRSATIERMQGAFISNEEVQRVVDFIKSHNESYFDAKIKDAIYNDKEEEDKKENKKKAHDKGLPPELFDALQLGMDNPGDRMSATFLQRKLGLGWPKAAKIMDMMTDLGYLVDDPTNPKIKHVEITQEEFDELVSQDEEEEE